MGKGDTRRQAQVSDEELARRWSDTFGGDAVWDYDYGQPIEPMVCLDCSAPISDYWNVHQIEDHEGTIRAPYCQDCYERLTK